MVKAACHIHSDWSYDGSWSLPRLAAAFSKRGYRILLMTEHDRGFDQGRFVRYRQACVEATSADMLLIPGIEYSDPGNSIHILTWGLEFFLGENLSTDFVLQQCYAAGGIAVLAHPSRRQAWKLFDHSWTPYLTAIELWNRKADGWAASAKAAGLLSATDKLLPFAGLDFHNARQFFPLAMEAELSGKLSEAYVLKAFRAGKFRGKAFGKPIAKVTQGTSSSVLRFAEWHRRRAAKVVRVLTG